MLSAWRFAKHRATAHRAIGNGLIAVGAILPGVGGGMAKAGMGVAVGDYDDDGDEDLLVVNLREQSDSFFLNEEGFFQDHTGLAGLATAV